MEKQFIVERDLFMSKLERYLNNMTEKGYEVFDMFPSGQEKWQKNNRVDKVTVVLQKSE